MYYAGEYLNKGKLGEDGTKINDKFIIMGRPSMARSIPCRGNPSR